MTKSDTSANRIDRYPVVGQSARAIDAVARGLSHMGGLLLMGLMALLVADVLLRATGGPLIPGTIGMSEVMMAVAIFFALAHTHRTRGNIRVELVVTRLPGRARWVADRLNDLLVAGASIFVAYYAVPPAIRSVRVNEHWVGARINIPMWPARYGLVVGAVALALVALRLLLAPPDPADHDPEVL